MSPRYTHFGKCHCAPNEYQGEACPIIAEFRRSPAESRELYQQELRRRIAERSQAAGVDVPYRLQKLGVPADAVLAIRNPFDNAALNAAKRLIGAPKDLVRLLLLAGPKGCGKTTAGAFALADFVRHWEWDSQPSGGRANDPCMWVNAAEVTLQQDFGRVSPDWLEGLRRCHFLVVDDLGHDATEQGMAALTSLLLHRHEKQRRTVVTCNLSPEGLKKRYGDAWYDRVRSAAIVPDLRQEKSLRKTRPEFR